VGFELALRIEGKLLQSAFAALRVDSPGRPSPYRGKKVPLKTITSDPSARNAEAGGVCKNSTNWLP
jgi:hypothetical protein